VLIQLEGNNAGFELGDKIVASIDVGRRSLLGRWLKPAPELATPPRVAFVEDPTELRRPLEPRPEAVAAVHELSSERTGVRNGADGG
jgi:hypothetical protein